MPARQTVYTIDGCSVKPSQLLKISLIFIACLVLLYGHIPESEDATAIVQMMQHATVQIRAYSSSGRNVKHGTGFFVSEGGDLITNWHVLDGVHRAEVETVDGDVYDIQEILAEDRERDLILVRVGMDGVNAPSSVVCREHVQSGDSIFMIANTVEQGRMVYRGVVIDTVEALPYGTVVHMTVPVYPGASGSPVVNVHGEVIGVATYRCVINGNWSFFAVPAHTIMDLAAHEGHTFDAWYAGNKDDDFFKAAGLYRRGLEYASRGIYTTAVQYLDRAIDLKPDCADMYTQLGICYERLGCYDDAIIAFRKAILLQPECSEAYCGLGVALCMAGEYTTGARAFEELIRLKPHYTEAYYNLGITYNNLEEYQDAVRILGKLVLLRPDFVKGYCELSLAYVSIGDYDNALAVLKQAQDIDPENAHVQYGMGIAYTNLMQYDEAIEVLCSATSSEPDWAQAHFLLGVNYGCLGQHKKEIDSYTKAIKLKPDFAEAYFNLAVTCAARGDRKIAIDQYTSLKNIDPERAAHLLQIIESVAQE
jgi:tetratricopeptide (TPR) repeat protein